MRTTTMTGHTLNFPKTVHPVQTVCGKTIDHRLESIVRLWAKQKQRTQWFTVAVRRGWIRHTWIERETIARIDSFFISPQSPFDAMSVEWARAGIEIGCANLENANFAKRIQFDSLKRYFHCCVIGFAVVMDAKNQNEQSFCENLVRHSNSEFAHSQVR